MQPGSGVAPLDAVLTARHLVDPVTGAPITARDAFADFVIANAVDTPFGDGRYYHQALQLPQGQSAATTTITVPSSQSDLSVNQFAAQYFIYTATAAQTIAIGFNGSPTAPRLTLPADRDPADCFYWSGGSRDADATLTRAVDLSGVPQATLQFDTWYSLAADRNYGYVSVSTDDGATWQALAATNTSPEDRYGAAYGVGFTGISNQAKPRPFPVLGVVLAGDGVTITDVTLGGPAAQAGVQPNDTIIGYDGHVWQGAPNVIGLLSNYAPGDTLHLYIRRGGEVKDIPVLLGAHPTRTIQPEPLWLPQTVDLTPYAGKSILLRFEAITLPGHEDQGLALDNIAIPAINFSDDVSGDAAGWTLDGWQQVDNQLPQRWIVQAVTSGTQTKPARVRPLIAPEDSATSVDTTLSLDAGEALLLAVSGVNDDTIAPATFSLTLK
jgi:PDZ domain/Immune inhibitor A-like, MAM domain